MEEYGLRNLERGIETTGLANLSSLRWNLTEGELVETAIRRGEGKLTAHGALVVTTGQHTGRSPRDKFVVRDETTENRIWWDNNKPMAPDAFERLYADFKAHAEGRDLFVQDLVGGADAGNAVHARVVTEFAWHSLFIRNLLIRPSAAELESFEIGRAHV